MFGLRFLGFYFLADDSSLISFGTFCGDFDGDLYGDFLGDFVPCFSFDVFLLILPISDMFLLMISSYIFPVLLLE